MPQRAVSFQNLGARECPGKISPFVRIHRSCLLHTKYLIEGVSPAITWVLTR